MSETIEKAGLARLRKIKTTYQTLIRENFEFAAKSCGACETFGACCVDEHFVNVGISKLEAVAVIEVIKSKHGETKLREVRERAKVAIEKYGLRDDGDLSQTFACPLFEQNIGCLVHDEAKPAPCISHACYENRENLPPQFLQDRAESQIETLNKEIYGESKLRSIPIQITLQNK